MTKPPLNEVLIGDCREVMKSLPENYVSACITDPPYNYEFIGHKWDDSIVRKIKRLSRTFPMAAV
jgi:site-specific DNA-methyltransferase (adenine-specific)